MSYILYLALLIPGQDPATPEVAPPAAVAVDQADGKAAEQAAENAKPADLKPAEAASATESTEPVETGKTFSDVFDELCKTGALGFMLRGGIFMWPILACGILAAGVLIERYRTLKLLNTDASTLRNDVRNYLLHDQIEEALQSCDRETGPVPAILAAGLRKFLILRRLGYDPGKIEDQVVKAMEDYGVHVVAALEKHLPILATISSVAPMLGFLGTVSGMITSFDDIVAASKAGNTNIVEASAAGIAEALLTTLLGLVVGIPAFSGYNYFAGVINKFVLDVEESSSELIETVTQQMTLEQQATEKTGV